MSSARSGQMNRNVLLVLLSIPIGCSGAAKDPGGAPIPEVTEPLRIAPDPSGRDESNCVEGDRDRIRDPGIIFDSAAFDRLAARLSDEGSLVLSVGTDSIGLPTRFRVVESSFPEEVAEAFRDSAALHFRPAGSPKSTSVSMRIRVDGGPVPRVRTGPTWLCDPVLANREYVSRLLGRAAAQAVRSGEALVWVRVAVDGSAGGARLEESSGDDFTDALALGVATQMTFLPAVRDRDPVAVWIQIPISITP